MKKLCAVASIIVGVFVAAGCNRQDSREATDNAQKQLDVTREKLREDLKKADAQTREDLARDQLHHALNQSESDADKARDKLRDRDKDRDDNSK
jgi:glucose-6-phosphate-specific signal transduction histidine kinase